MDAALPDVRISGTTRSGVPCSAWFGWFVICIHDYPEPEGNVWLPMDDPPRKGDLLKLPSDGSVWEVRSVNDHDGELTVIQPNNVITEPIHAYQ